MNASKNFRGDKMLELISVIFSLEGLSEIPIWKELYYLCSIEKVIYTWDQTAIASNKES